MLTDLDRAKILLVLISEVRESLEVKSLWKMTLFSLELELASTSCSVSVNNLLILVI